MGGPEELEQARRVLTAAVEALKKAQRVAKKSEREQDRQYVEVADDDVKNWEKEVIEHERQLHQVELEIVSKVSRHGHWTKSGSKL